MVRSRIGSASLRGERRRPIRGYSAGRTGAIYALLSLARPAANFVVLPFLVALLPPTELGLYVLLTPIWWICQTLLTLGTNEALGRLAASQEDGVRRALLQITGMAALLAMAVLTALSFASAYVLGIPFSALVAYVIVLGLFQAITATAVSVLRARLKVARASTILAASTIFTTLPGLFSVWLVAPTSTVFFAANCLGSAIVTIYALIACVLSLPSGVKTSKGLFRVSLRIGIPLIPQLIVPLVSETVIRRLVLQFAGLEAVGVFGVGLAIGGVAGLLVKAGIQAWSPMFFRQRREDCVPYAARSTSIILILIGIYATICMLVLTTASEILSQFGLHSPELTLVVIITIAAASPLALLLGATYVGLYFHRTVHASWTTLVGGAIGVLSAVALSLTVGWPWLAIAPAIGNLLALGLFTTSERRIPAKQFIRSRAGRYALANVVICALLLGAFSSIGPLAATVCAAVALLYYVLETLRLVRANHASQNPHPGPQ